MRICVTHLDNFWQTMTELNLAQIIISWTWLYEVDENLFDYIVTERKQESLTQHVLLSIEDDMAKIHRMLQDTSLKWCFVLSSLTYQMALEHFGDKFKNQTIIDLGPGFTSTKFKYSTEAELIFPFFEPIDAIDFYQTLHSWNSYYIRIHDAIYADDLDLAYEKSMKRVHIDQLMTWDQCLIVSTWVWFPMLVKTSEILVERWIWALFWIYRYSDFFDNILIAAATQAWGKLLVICDYQSSAYQEYISQLANSAWLLVQFVYPWDINQSLIEWEYGSAWGPEFRSDMIGQKIALMYN